MYKGTGSSLIAYAEDHGVPYILATDDVAFSCSMVESFAPFLLSFSRIISSPEQLAVLFYVMTGNCIEYKAWNEELRYLRAIYTKDPIEAEDARIAQQHFLVLAAQRQLTGYHYLGLAYSEPGAECPLLNTDKDEFYWLMGLISGLQAILNDIAAAGNADVPLDIAAKIGRSASCLNNKKWWGVPEAIQATIWITIPANKPFDKDPYQVLTGSMKRGIEQGIAISHVLAAQVYLGLGKIETVKHIIRDYSKPNNQRIINEAYKILNQVSTMQIQHISDRLWTETTGHRTPIGKIGTFANDPVQDTDLIDIEAIL